MPCDYTALALGCIPGFYMAWNIGGNDVANSMASAVAAVAVRRAMVIAARQHFKNYCNAQRTVVKDIIHGLRKKRHEADKLEHTLKQKTFACLLDPVTILHIIRLAEIIGSVDDHAENAGDMLRGMIAKE